MKIKKDELKTLEQFKEKIEVLWKEQKILEGKKAISEALKKFPACSWLWLLEAKFEKMVEDDHSEAIRYDLEIALKLDPDNIYALKELADHVYCLEDSPKEAFLYYKQCEKKLTKVLNEVLWGMAACIDEIDGPQEALEFAHNVLNRSSNNVLLQDEIKFFKDEIKKKKKRKWVNKIKTFLKGDKNETFKKD